AGFAKLGHVVRDRRLRDVEGGREVADAHRLLGVAQAERDLQAGRIGERLQDLARLFDLLGPRFEDRRAAHPTLALREHHELFHRQSLADPLTNVNGFGSVPSTLVYASEVPSERHSGSRSRALCRKSAADGGQRRLLRHELLWRCGMWRGIYRAGARL